MESSFINSVVVSLLVAVCVFGSKLKSPKSLNYDRTPRIVGGHVVDIEDAPFMVSLQYNGFHLCGATIIHKKFILTAAHCERSGAPLDQYSFRAETSYKNQDGNVVKIKRKINHPQFNLVSADYDFAILELENELNFNSKCQPLKLPEKTQNVDDGTLLYTYGWGQTQNSQESSSKLRGVEIPKVSQSSCSKAYAIFAKDITDRMICVGYTQGGKNACFGDSGGPLVLNGSLVVGVVSWGFSECAHPSYPGVYARVASVRDWIDGVINS
ncbi:hypothetical protein DMENIID0001_168520 [Sergentomyia squamirostris]